MSCPTTDGEFPESKPKLAPDLYVGGREVSLLNGVLGNVGTVSQIASQDVLITHTQFSWRADDTGERFGELVVRVKPII